MLINNYAEICPVASAASRMFATTGAIPAEGSAVGKEYFQFSWISTTITIFSMHLF